jgi:hypothetical protein
VDNQAHKNDWIRQEHESQRSKFNQKVVWATDWWGISLCAIAKALGMEESRFAQLFIKEELPKMMKAYIFNIIKETLTEDGYFNDECQDDFETQLKECFERMETSRKKAYREKIQQNNEDAYHSKFAHIPLSSLLDWKRGAKK